MSNSLVPRTAERILEALGANTDFREAVIGDLAEELELRASLDGEHAARRWYWRESLRVAPHLLRDWWRGLSRTDVWYFARAVVGTMAATVVFEFALKMGTLWLGLYDGLFRRAASEGFLPLAALMLVWTMLDGLFAGCVAARLGRRAPLATVLTVATAGALVMIPVLAQQPLIALLFRIVNLGTFAAGMLAGGVLATLHMRERKHQPAVSIE